MTAVGAAPGVAEPRVTPYKGFWNAVHNLATHNPTAPQQFHWPLESDAEVYGHRDDDFALLAFKMLRCCVGMRLSEHRHWRLTGIGQMFGSGKTSIGKGVIPALTRRSVREKLAALVASRTDGSLVSALATLLSSIPEDGVPVPATGPVAELATTVSSLGCSSHSLHASRGSLVYLFVTLANSNDESSIVCAINRSLGEFCGNLGVKFSLDHPLMPQLVRLINACTTRGWSVMLHFDEVSNLNADAITALHRACVDAAASREAVFYLLTGRHLPLRPTDWSPSQAYDLMFLSCLARAQLEPLLTSLFAHNEVALVKDGTDRVSFMRAATVGSAEPTLLGTGLDVTDFLDRVYDSTAGAPRLVMMCFMSLWFRLVVREQETSSQFHLSPERIVDYVYSELLHRPAEYLWDEKVTRAGDATLFEALRVALVHSTLKIPLDVDVVLAESSGRKVTLSQLQRCFPVYTTPAAPAAAAVGDVVLRDTSTQPPVIIIVPQFCMRFALERMEDDDIVTKQLCLLVRNRFRESSEVGWALELLAGVRVVQAMRRTVTSALLPCTVGTLFPFLSACSFATLNVAECGWSDALPMPDVNGHAVSIETLCSSVPHWRSGYYTHPVFTWHGSDAFLLIKVVVGNVVKVILVAWQYKGGVTQEVTPAMLAKEFPKLSPAVFTNVTEFVFVVFCQQGLGSELGEVAGSALPALTLGDGAWHRATLSISGHDVSVDCLVNEVRSEFIARGCTFKLAEHSKRGDIHSRLVSFKSMSYAVDFSSCPALLGELTLPAAAATRRSSRDVPVALAPKPDYSICVMVPKGYTVVIPTKAAVGAFLGPAAVSHLGELVKRENRNSTAVSRFLMDLGAFAG